MPINPEQANEQARIAEALAKVGFVLPGTLLERRLTCTHTGCHCHDDPPALHGPYYQWSRKIRAKTVSTTLSPDQVDDYRPWFDNKRHLRALVHELEALSLAIIQADPRTPRRR